MLFNPQEYKIEDKAGSPFIDPDEIREIQASAARPSGDEVRMAVAKSLSRERLSLRETALLLNCGDEILWKEIYAGASRLKKEVYGDRVVLFAPLYVGNRCSNDCAYCGFRSTNREAMRRTLDAGEIKAEVEALLGGGHRRLILVWGEHPAYSPKHIAETVKQVYAAGGQSPHIARVNINAAPLDVDGFRTVKESGIGTYQIFQETYDPEIYARYHLAGRKSDYAYRLTALDRAMQAGIDDVGIGVLLGLGDWRFEVMALVRHVNHLEACFGVGPHTISFPRIRSALNNALDAGGVSDEDFRKVVAVLRLAVPYAGLILTAREPESLRDELMGLGVSQIDAGTNLELGGYSEGRDGQDLSREQFELADTRTLGENIGELVGRGYIPSFCTACYRKGRTGEHFMEFSTKGFIKKFCTPNAIVTFAEYLADHADPELVRRGTDLIHRKLEEIGDPVLRTKVQEALERIDSGERGLDF